MSDIIQDGPMRTLHRRLPGVHGPGSWGVVAEGSDWSLWQVDVTHMPSFNPHAQVMVCGVCVER